MKNFPITDPETGKTFWISRALAVCAIILAYDDSKTPYLFLQKRGDNCPDYQGCWSHTCGYLDFDETLKGAVGREIYEEIGLGLRTVQAKVTTHSWNDRPSEDPRQNVTVRYVIQVKLNDLTGALDLNSLERGGEESEVSDFRIIKLSGDFEDKLKELEFAFNHAQLTSEILCDPRFIPSAEDIRFGSYMTSDRMKSHIIVGSTAWSVLIERDLAGVIKIVCPDLGVTFTPAGLPAEILGYIRYNMVPE